jgi:hypothetical protein
MPDDLLENYIVRISPPRRVTAPVSSAFIPDVKSGKTPI